MTMGEHCRDLKSLKLFPVAAKGRNTKKNVRSVRRANRYAFRINICSIHDGILLWMHPSSHSHTYINKHVFALVSPVSFFLSFSLLGFLPLLYDTTAASTFHCNLPANPECGLWILKTELTERLAMIFIHDGVIDFATTFIAVKNKMFFYENKKWRILCNFIAYPMF